MYRKNNTSNDSVIYRQGAEDLLKKRTYRPDVQHAEADIQKLIHELEVHQIELEMQNEELMLAEEQAEEFNLKYAELYDFAPIGYFTLSNEGKIFEINICGANMLGRERLRLKNSSFDFFVSDDTKPIFNNFLDKVFISGAMETCELILSVDSDVPICIQITGIVNENEEQCLVTMLNITELKKADTTIRESEERYRSLFENLLDGFAHCKMRYDEFNKPIDFTYLDVNKSFEILTGLKDVVGKNVSEVIPGIRELSPELFESYGRVATTGIPERFEFDFKSLNQWLDISVYCPKMGYFIAVFENITERKNAEEQLRKKTEELNNYFTHALDLFCIADANGYFRRLNKQWETTLGYTLGELEGKQFFDLVHPDDLNATLSRITDLDASKEVSVFVNRFRCKDDTYKWIEWRSYSSNKMIYSAARDITERKVAQDTLQESEERFRAIFEQAAIGVALLNTKTGQFVRINQKYCDFVGYTIQEMLQKTYMDITYQEDIQTNLDNVNMFIEGTNKESSFEKRYVHKNGSILWGNITISPLWKPNEKPSTYFHIAIVENINERKIAEHELAKAKQKAEESDKLKSAFLANMSHEIRTPLNIILGYSELIGDDAISKAKRVEYIDIINQNSTRLLDLINSILDSSKIAAGQMELNIKPFNINHLIDELYAQNKLKTKFKNIELIYRKGLPDELDLINTSEQFLYQILTNLLNNAIKYSDAGSIEYGYKLLNNQLELFVKDTGIGISEAYKTRLFEQFSQEDFSLHRLHEGVGLGLSIVKGLVDLLKGSIAVESEKGRGTKFTVCLPIEISDTNNIEEIRKHKNRKPLMSNIINPENNSHSFITLLIVEDDNASFQLLKFQLKKYGCQIIRAINGAEAIVFVKAHSDFACVLMDMHLPEMDGCETTLEIKKIRKDLPVYALTAAVMDEEKERALKAGCDAFFSKPVDLKKLFAMIG